jgi:prophage DNA circulation protein
MPKTDATTERDAMVQALHDSMALRSPAEFVETMELPHDLYVAIATGRPELITLATARDMTAAEVAELYEVIAVLIRTNYALQVHARELAKMASDFGRQMHGAARQIAAIEQFADFRKSDNDDR